MKIRNDDCGGGLEDDGYAQGEAGVVAAFNFYLFNRLAFKIKCLLWFGDAGGGFGRYSENYVVTV